MVPGSTVVAQYISLSQQITICLMIASIRPQLKKLQNNRIQLIYCNLMQESHLIHESIISFGNLLVLEGISLLLIVVNLVHILFLAAM